MVGVCRFVPDFADALAELMGRAVAQRCARALLLVSVVGGGCVVGMLPSVLSIGFLWAPLPRAELVRRFVVGFVGRAASVASLNVRMDIALFVLGGFFLVGCFGERPFTRLLSEVLESEDVFLRVATVEHAVSNHQQELLAEVGLWAVGGWMISVWIRRRNCGQRTACPDADSRRWCCVVLAC